MSQVAQGLFQLNFENLHRQRFYSVFRKSAAVPHQLQCKFFLTSNWNFPACPSPGTSEKCLTFLFSAISFQMKEDGNECPLYPSLLSKPYFFNHSTQAICFSLHHDPTEVTPEGWLLMPQGAQNCAVTPGISQKHLSREQGPSLTCWQCPG